MHLFGSAPDSDSTGTKMGGSPGTISRHARKIPGVIRSGSIVGSSFTSVKLDETGVVEPSRQSLRRSRGSGTEAISDLALLVVAVLIMRCWARERRE